MVIFHHVSPVFKAFSPSIPEKSRLFKGGNSTEDRFLNKIQPELLGSAPEPLVDLPQALGATKMLPKKNMGSVSYDSSS